jgi:hypothetical protein
MDKKIQIILGGAVLVGAYFLYQNSKKTKGLTSNEPSLSSDNDERKKLYDEIFESWMLYAKNKEINNQRGKNQISGGVSKEKATNAYKRIILSNPNFKGDAADAYNLEMIQPNIDAIEEKIKKFILPEIYKMTINELKLYSNGLKISNQITTNEPINYKDMKDLLIKYPTLKID